LSLPSNFGRRIVDAMNVIGSRPTGWWRDRPAAVRRLVRRLQRLAAADGRPITVVVDGYPLDGLAEGKHDGVEVLYASRAGRNAADDRIAEIVAADPNSGGLEVVTADRDLSDRVRRMGARVSGPGELLRQLDALEEKI
jgi:predicted RNA-binding protein with PIN domain